MNYECIQTNCKGLVARSQDDPSLWICDMCGTKYTSHDKKEKPKESQKDYKTIFFSLIDNDIIKLFGFFMMVVFIVEMFWWMMSEITKSDWINIWNIIVYSMCAFWFFYMAFELGERKSKK